ncbi:alpha-D-xyloside xylohydrolase [Filimonas zeae]|uniref:Xylosidase n=1 Tax=Filimonas zeae TaxID=1737353 RepID=A0A917IVY4_9BACT|nr:TIM-barrel domain-containing protein [Filimonas zeae]MDR6339477.1 alpha-D-xyloside xylohydrolase [Filimonas zeae]GGH63437.1 xylosidase [Filimonas zeae]
MNVQLSKTLCLLLVVTLWGPVQKAKAQQFTRTANGIGFTTQELHIKVDFYAGNIVRVSKTPVATSSAKESLSVIKTPETTAFTVKEQGGLVVLESAALRVHCNTQTGRVSFLALNGQPLFTEKDYGAQFTPVNDAGVPAYNVRQAFLLDKGEAIYGLGQTQTDKMNQRNVKLYMRQFPLYAYIPIVQSTKGYAVFWDNYSPTTFNDNPQEMSFDSEIGNCADYYFMYGKSGDGNIALIRELTGQAPMFPLWTFGFWQSRERYKTQQETMDVVDKYRSLGVPLDGIIQDWQYWGKDSAWNAMEFLNPGFPKPQEMIDHVHRRNAHFMISVWPGFGPLTRQYQYFKQNNMLIDFETWPPKSGARVYDVFHPEARRKYWGYMNELLFAKGVDAWWLDSTDPDHINIKDADFDKPTYLGSYRKVHNAFPLMTNGGVYTHQRQTSADKRVYLLTRNAFAGQQRYGANTWSGDLRSTWGVFKKQIPTGLNFSITGIPYWNTDIGGFFLWDYEGGVANKAYQELYTRWFQYGTFTPMQRSHGSGVSKEIWYFGKKGDWAYDSEEKYINLRYALLPYLYSTGWQVTKQAGSFLRPLFMDFNSDTAVHNISNAYMFGRSFLVTPVTDAMYVTGTGEKWKDPKEDFSKTGKQPVYLPQGTQWIDFWTGQTLNGGQTVQKEVPVDIIPLYVRAGSVIPFGPKVQYATEQKWDNLEIRIYPGADGEFVLYEDENDNYNYEKGKYATISFTWNNASRTLTIGNREGGFAGMLTKRKFKVVVVGEQKGAGDAAAKADKTITYSGKLSTVKL